MKTTVRVPDENEPRKVAVSGETVMSDADLVAHRASQVITTMGAEIRELRASRDRYRMAWLSARQRAVRLADETATRSDVGTEFARQADQPDEDGLAAWEGSLTDEDDTVHSCPGRWGGPDCRCFD